MKFRNRARRINDCLRCCRHCQLVSFGIAFLATFRRKSSSWRSIQIWVSLQRYTWVSKESLVRAKESYEEREQNERQIFIGWL